MLNLRTSKLEGSLYSVEPHNVKPHIGPHCVEPFRLTTLSLSGVLKIGKERGQNAHESKGAPSVS